MRAAVYSGTRNVYEQMLTAAKSLLVHSNVEKIYFLIEDDQFPYELPPEVECKNVSNQTYFSPEGPNFQNKWSYMVLLRAAYTKIFPDLDKILSLDIDTIVEENVSELWDIDISKYYLAAAEEIPVQGRDIPYFNMGVVMFNLNKIREDKQDDVAINALNTYLYLLAEQDCFNELFHNNVYLLPSDYDIDSYNAAPHREKILHFAAMNNYTTFPVYQRYKNLPLSEIKRNVKDDISLDIIVPTYKNKPGLIRTLKSIPQSSRINVIVVDDCSDENYDDILKQYPYIHFYRLDKNSGPGMTRQFGIDQGNGTYITFLDTDDYFYEGGAETILNDIWHNTYIKFYSYSYVLDDRNILIDTPGNKTIGNVYKRSFLTDYNIRFNPEGSYANEDYGFVRASRAILASFTRTRFPSMIKHIKIPVFYEHIDEKSITKIDDNLYFYTKIIPGIITNGTAALKIMRKANIDVNVIIQEASRILGYTFAYLMCIGATHKEYSQQAWEAIRKYYYDTYKQYNKVAGIFFYDIETKLIASILRRFNIQTQFRVSLRHLLLELENNAKCPQHYMR